MQVKKAALRPSFVMRTSQTWVRRPTCSGRPTREDVARAPAANTLAFSSAVVKSLAVVEVPEGAPGGDAVGERHPDATVHVAAGVEVAPIDREPALHLVVLDPDHLDPEVAGKLPAMRSRKQLRGDRRVGQAARSSTAPPS